MLHSFQTALPSEERTSHRNGLQRQPQSAAATSFGRPLCGGAALQPQRTELLAAVASGAAACWSARRRAHEHRRHQQQRSRLPTSLRATAGEAAPSAPRIKWYSARSRLEVAEEAVTEAVGKWRTDLAADAMPIPEASQWIERIAPEQYPAFEEVAKVWHDWRARSYGDISLAQALQTGAAAQGSNASALQAVFQLGPIGFDALYPDWRQQLRWERPGSSSPDEQWKARMRKGAVAAEIRRTAEALGGTSVAEASEPRAEGWRPGYALVFVPARWASQLEVVAEQIELQLGWSNFPFIAVLSEGTYLTIGTAFVAAGYPLPHAFSMGEAELDEAGAEGYRLQEQLDDNLARNHYTDYYRQHGRTNGTVIACRRLLDRAPANVGSVLLFLDPLSAARIPREVVGLLDSAFPNAVTAGLIAASSFEAPGKCLYVGGPFGGLRRRGTVGLLLPGEADTAVGLCGCEPCGPLWEVYDADVDISSTILRTVTDPSSEQRDANGRRVGRPAGRALLETVTDEDASVWVGIPRVPRRLSSQVVPGVGEWALYGAGTVTVEGSLVLQGCGPGAEGVGSRSTLGGLSLSRVQAFRTVPDLEALGRLRAAYDMDRLLAGRLVQDGVKPYATFVFGGGDGPRASLLDEALYNGVCFGSAVLGAPGNMLADVSSDDKVRDIARDGPPPHRATLVHRQAVGLVHLYA
mmetsp:Transcript_35199/g.64285  ORF Transcript_35199/g.64285 Transcript_35199/m.64285 type:complete len:694 (+) Transcript_35199:69-2150(+)